MPRIAGLLERADALSPRDWVIVGAVTLLVVSLTALGIAGALLVRSIGSIKHDARRIHLQQATIIGMLLKAGFRPAKTLDWFDNGDETRQLGEPALTQFDWRKP